MRHLLGVLFASGALLAVVPAARPEEPAGARLPVRTDAFGVSSETVTSIPAWGFQTIESGITFQYATGGYLSRSGGASTGFVAPIQLPSGVEILGIELEGCDDSTGSGVELHLFVCGGPGDFCLDQTDYLVGTGGFSTVGCAYFARTATSPLTVSNADHTYFLQIVDADTSPMTRFRTARVRWRRQLSPAPASATFADVPPSHPFFQHVEALFDSGITAGCGEGNFCPDRPITRGELAVFLSKALGLHWPD
jgi:S-layer homology domain